MTDRAKIIVEDNTVEYPVEQATIGDRGIDIRHLRRDTGLVTLDVGLGNTGSCKSSISCIAATRSNSWPNRRVFRKLRICSSTASCRRPSSRRSGARS